MNTLESIGLEFTTDAIVKDAVKNIEELPTDNVGIHTNSKGTNELVEEEDTGPASDTMCSICYEPSGQTVNVCSAEACKFCVGCFRSYVKLMVEKAWACPELRCPGCKARMETSEWQAHAAESEVVMYNHRLKHIVGVRCPSCHTPKSMFVETPPAEVEIATAMAALVDAKAESKVDQEQEQELAVALSQYAAGQLAPRSMVDCLVAHVGSDVQALAALASPALWCALASDVERRTSLQLAWYRRSPKVATPCCARTMCFKCQTRDWHEGKTCAEMEERMNLDTMLCPACDVAIMKSEGCSHMICPCGTQFTWDPAKQRLQREQAERARREAEEARIRARALLRANARMLSQIRSLRAATEAVAAVGGEATAGEGDGEGDGEGGDGGAVEGGGAWEESVSEDEEGGGSPEDVARLERARQVHRASEQMWEVTQGRRAVEAQFASLAEDLSRIFAARQA